MWEGGVGPFLPSLVTYRGLERSKIWSILDQIGQTWQACQRSKVVQKGPKGTKMVNLSVFDHLGPFWVHLDPFGPFQTKMNFLPQMDKVGFGGGASEQKINFCLKWSKRVQMGPKGSQMVKNTFRLTILDPFGPLWNVDKPAMFGHFWSKMDHF